MRPFAIVFFFACCVVTLIANQAPTVHLRADNSLREGARTEPTGIVLNEDQLPPIAAPPPITVPPVTIEVRPYPNPQEVVKFVQDWVQAITLIVTILVGFVVWLMGKWKEGRLKWEETQRQLQRVSNRADANSRDLVSVAKNTPGVEPSELHSTKLAEAEKLEDARIPGAVPTPPPKSTRLPLALAFLVLMCYGCASTKVNYPNGKTAFSTQANAEDISFTAGAGATAVAFHAAKLNHSTPTRAGGSVVGTGATGLTSLLVAWLTKGAAK